MMQRSLCTAVLCAAAVPLATPLPAYEVAVNVSWGDHLVIPGDELDTPEKIRADVGRWHRIYGMTQMLWRVDNSPKAWLKHFRMNLTDPFAKQIEERTQQIFAEFDPEETAVREAHRVGVRALAYVTMFDEGCPPEVFYGGTTSFPYQSRFLIEHPEYQVVDRTGEHYQWGVMEYAYPQARRQMIQRYRDIVNRYGFNGLYVCTRTHSPPAEHADQFGFNDPIVEEYRRRYGVDIRTEQFDKEKWRRLRGEYFVQFFRELRQALPDVFIAAGVPRGRYIGPPYGNMYLDWETLVREKLVDELVIGVYSGRSLYPNRQQPHAPLGYLCSEGDGIGIPSYEECLDTVYGPLCEEHGVTLLVNFPAYEGPRTCDLEGRPHFGGVMMHSTMARGTAGTVRVRANPKLEFTDGQMTVEFWLKPREMPNNGVYVLSKYNHTLAADAGRGWEVLLHPPGTITFCVNHPQTGQVELSSQTPIPLDQWSHVACVLDGPSRTMRLYINGREDAAREDGPPGVRATPQVSLWIGRYGGGDISPYRGLIDELRISNVARSFDEPPSAPYTTAEAGTVALYDFDGVADDGTIRNAEGDTALDGVLVGQPQVLKPSMPGFGAALQIGLGP